MRACSFIKLLQEDYVLSYPTTTRHARVPSTHRLLLLRVTLAVNQHPVALHLNHCCNHYGSLQTPETLHARLLTWCPARGADLRIVIAGLYQAFAREACFYLAR